jgi:predicted small lipoprotein YifL
MVLVVALGLSACGKRGDPVPPDEKTDEFPRQYPDPSSL